MKLLMLKRFLVTLVVCSLFSNLKPAGNLLGELGQLWEKNHGKTFVVALPDHGQKSFRHNNGKVDALILKDRTDIYLDFVFLDFVEPHYRSGEDVPYKRRIILRL